MVVKPSRSILPSLWAVSTLTKDLLREVFYDNRNFTLRRRLSSLESRILCLIHLLQELHLALDSLSRESEPLKPSEINKNSSTSQIIEIVEDKEIPRYKTTADVQIIDLDEDEEDCSTALKENDPSTTDACYKIVEAVISERQKVWHYIDPLGNEQGPFALASLRYWKDEGFFDDDFRVWRAGQSKEDAILLIDALR